MLITRRIDEAHETVTEFPSKTEVTIGGLSLDVLLLRKGPRRGGRDDTSLQHLSVSVRRPDRGGFRMQGRGGELFNSTLFAGNASRRHCFEEIVHFFAPRPIVPFPEALAAVHLTLFSSSESLEKAQESGTETSIPPAT